MSTIVTNPYAKMASGNCEASRSSQSAAWSPAVDIYETQTEIVVKAELPGIVKGDLQVQVEKNLLTISGSRPQHNDEDVRNVLRLERPWGKFNRRFSLPGNIDQGRIRSEFNQGILRVYLPKREEVKPRQIEVTIN